MTKGVHQIGLTVSTLVASSAFMTRCMPTRGCGRGLLREALETEGLSEKLMKRWLKIDKTFWSRIRSDSLACRFQI